MFNRKLTATEEIKSEHKHDAFSNAFNNYTNNKTLFAIQTSSASNIRKSTGSALKRNLKVDRSVLKQIKSSPSTAKIQASLQRHSHQENLQSGKNCKFKEQKTMFSQNRIREGEKKELSQTITYGEGKSPSDNIFKSSRTKTINRQEKADVCNISNKIFKPLTPGTSVSRKSIETDIMKKTELLRKGKHSNCEVFAAKEKDEFAKSEREKTLILESKSKVPEPGLGKDSLSSVSKTLHPLIHSKSSKITKVNNSSKISPYSPALKSKLSKASASSKRVQGFCILEEVTRNLNFLSPNFSRLPISKMKNSNVGVKLRKLQSAKLTSIKSSSNSDKIFSKGQIHRNASSKSALATPLKSAENRKKTSSKVDYKISESRSIPAKQISQLKIKKLDKKDVTGDKLNSISRQSLTQKFNSLSVRVKSSVSSRFKANPIDQLETPNEFAKKKNILSSLERKHKSQSDIKRALKDSKTKIRSTCHSIAETETSDKSAVSCDNTSGIKSRTKVKKKEPDKVDEFEKKEQLPNIANQTENFLKQFGPNKTFIIASEQCQAKDNNEVKWVESELWSENLEKAFVRGRAIGLTLLQTMKATKTEEQITI